MKSVGLVLFADGTDPKKLAGIFGTGPNGLALLDLPGNSLDHDSTWRVDDGGIFEPSGFEFTFEYKTHKGEKIGFVYTWGAAEGTALTFVEREGSVLKEMDEAFIYQGGH